MVRVGQPWFSRSICSLAHLPRYGALRFASRRSHPDLPYRCRATTLDRAYVALALGVLLNLYPLLLFPALFIAEQQVHNRFSMPPSSRIAIRNIPRTCGLLCWGLSLALGNALLFFVLIGGITGLFALLNFQGPLSPNCSIS